MARIEEVRLVDDLDGGPADETVQFALEKRDYEIDLSTPNADKFRGLLSEYVAAARPAGKTTGSGSASSKRSSSVQDRGRNRAIRDYARTKGWKIGDRGRIPGDVVEAYRLDETG